MDDKHQPQIIPFTARTKRGGEPPDGGDPSADAADLIAPGNAYATARAVKAAASLRFLLPGGRTFAMPYAYHPIIWGESPALVLIEYPRFFTVILAGKNLAQLEAQLCERRVTWIRQCSDAEIAALPIAVTRIERLNRYPSREPDATPPLAD